MALGGIPQEAKGMAHGSMIIIRDAFRLCIGQCSKLEVGLADLTSDHYREKRDDAPKNDSGRDSDVPSLDF